MPALNTLPFQGKEILFRGDRLLNDAFPGGQQYGGDAHVIASGSRYYCDGHGGPISSDGIWATGSGDGGGGTQKGQSLTGEKPEGHVQSRTKCLLASHEHFLYVRLPRCDVLICTVCVYLQLNMHIQYIEIYVLMYIYIYHT